MRYVHEVEGVCLAHQCQGCARFKGKLFIVSS